MRETINLEFKETVSNSFLKTVSAYANYGDGKILFGITDDGVQVGIENPRETCLQIENMINDSIIPQPQYSLDIDENTKVITLNVIKGKETPYMYKGKAYRRNDSSSIPVDRNSLRRLYLAGANLTFDSIQAQNQELTFSALENSCKTEMGITKLTNDLLITLELYSKDEGYNNAAELLADHNHFPGIDIARFGESTNIILNRHIFEKVSLLEQYKQAIDVFKLYYEYEQIEGFYRKNIERIPREAFREAIANALVHRDWDSNGYIQISMFDDHIKISSPGGLPAEITPEQYLHGQVSVLKNPILGGVFYRLHMIERYGTGTQRIIEAYKDSKKKPQFIIKDQYLEITLPLMERHLEHIDAVGERIYALIERGIETTSALSEISGYSRPTVLRHINNLIKYGYVRKNGDRKGATYSVL